MSQSGDGVGSVKQQLSKIFKASLQATFPNEQDVEPLVSASTAKFGDYQWYELNFLLVDEKFCSFDFELTCKLGGVSIFFH